VRLNSRNSWIGQW